jgi:hypothetical protein
MAVLVEGISVVVRRDAIEAKIDGGWQAFQELVPNQTLCTDGQLASVSFMSPIDVENFCQSLKQVGLLFTKKGTPHDFAVVGMDTGPTAATPWIEYLGKSKERKVSCCWLFEGERDKGFGTYMPSLSIDVAVPIGWTYEDSLTANHTFTPLDRRTRLMGWLYRSLTAVRSKLK